MAGDMDRVRALLVEGTFARLARGFAPPGAWATLG